MYCKSREYSCRARDELFDASLLLCLRVEWKGAERSESGLGRPELVRAVIGGTKRRNWEDLWMGTRFLVSSAGHYALVILWMFC